MADIIEKRWWAYSKKNGEFDILGYSKPGDDYRDDISKAMEVLAKHLQEPIPSDVEFCILSAEGTESEEYYAG